MKISLYKPRDVHCRTLCDNGSNKTTAFFRTSVSNFRLFSTCSLFNGSKGLLFHILYNELGNKSLCVGTTSCPAVYKRRVAE